MKSYPKTSIAMKKRVRPVQQYKKTTKRNDTFEQDYVGDVHNCRITNQTYMQ